MGVNPLFSSLPVTDPAQQQTLFGQQPLPAQQLPQQQFVQQQPQGQFTFNPEQFQLTPQQLQQFQPQPQQPLIQHNEPVVSNPTPVTDICLGCICQAVSNCNRTLACNGEVCGLFRITRPYWADAKKTVQNGETADSPGAFEHCVNEPLCAARTVQSYMSRFQQDCNNDGVINCYDHAAIHIHGGYGCSAPLPQHYSNTLQQCLAQAQNFQN